MEVMSDDQHHAIDTMLLEERRYPPPEEFTSQANAQAEIYDRDFDEFWTSEGRERVTWFEEFSKLYEWEPPYAKWYLGGTLNVCFNCVDRHVEAGLDAPGVKRCLVVRRTGGDVAMQDGRDSWLHDYAETVSDDPETCPCEPMDAEDLLFLMYTSGTTAKPKGIAHTTGGYLVGVATTHYYLFDLKPGQDV